MQRWLSSASGQPWTLEEEIGGIDVFFFWNMRVKGGSEACILKLCRLRGETDMRRERTKFRPVSVCSGDWNFTRHGPLGFEPPGALLRDLKASKVSRCGADPPSFLALLFCFSILRKVVKSRYTFRRENVFSPAQRRRDLGLWRLWRLAANKVKFQTLT